VPVRRCDPAGPRGSTEQDALAALDLIGAS
jgi:hypothetical protein